jgi:high-affinity iron transporter
MIESFIITLREGIEIALVLGVVITYLQKTGRTKLTASVYTGLIAAILASIGGAFLFEKLAIDQESIEGYFLLAAALMVITMIVWMWSTGKKIRSEIEERVGVLVQQTSDWKAYAGLFFFTFIMIVREGIETVLFLRAVMFNTTAWHSAAGTVAGIASAAVFAVLFIRGSVRIDIARFLKVTAITLLLFTLQLIVNAVHEFYEYDILPANPKMMGILGPIVQHDIIFIVAILSIPALMMIIPSRKSLALSAGPAHRRWQFSAGFATLVVILFLGVGDLFSTKTETKFDSELLTVPSSGVLDIPVGRVSDNTLHRFAIQDSGLEIRFFVLRTGMGSFSTAFDACYACYSYGHYYLGNGGLVCSQCDAVSPLSKLHQATEAPLDENMSGSMEGNGCTPIYLPSRLLNGNIEIRLADLEKRRKYFDITPDPAK